MDHTVALSRCSIDLIPLLAMICNPQCAIRRECAGTGSRDQATQISQRCCFDDVGPDTCSKFIEELLRQASRDACEFFPGLLPPGR